MNTNIHKLQVTSQYGLKLLHLAIHLWHQICPTKIYFVTDIKTGQILFHFFHTSCLWILIVCELQIHESSSGISEHTVINSQHVHRYQSVEYSNMLTRKYHCNVSHFLAFFFKVKVIASWTYMAPLFFGPHFWCMGKHCICRTKFFIPLSVNFNPFYVLIPIQFMSQEGRVSIVTRLWARWPGNHGSFLKMENIFFSYPECPQSLLYNGYQRRFVQAYSSQGMHLVMQLHLVLSLRMHGDISPLPHMPKWHHFALEFNVLILLQ